MFLYDQNIIGSSSKIFRTSGNLQKMFGNDCLALGQLLETLREIFGKYSEILGKSSKMSSLVCLYNKQNRLQIRTFSSRFQLDISLVRCAHLRDWLAALTREISS